MDLYEKNGNILYILYVLKKYTDDEYFKVNLCADTLGFKLWAMRNMDCVVVTKPKSLKKEIQDIIWFAGEKYAK